MYRYYFFVKANVRAQFSHSRFTLLRCLAAYTHLDVVCVGLQRYPKLLGELDREFRRVAPPELLAGARAASVVDDIRTFYFQQRPVDLRNIDSLIDVSSGCETQAPLETSNVDMGFQSRISSNKCKFSVGMYSHYHLKRIIIETR